MRVDPDGAWIDEQILDILRSADDDPVRRERRMSVLAIDAGTTGVTALVVTADGRIAARGYQEFAQHFPQPGLGRARARGDLAGDARGHPRGPRRGTTRRELQAVGITNQRETVLLWDRETLGSPRRAIVWQDRRTAAICDRLRDEGHEERVSELTGLRLDPYFSGTKLTWLARERAAHLGARRVGPVRRRHRRLLPRRPDDARHLARHRRLQRLAAPCCSTSRPATGPTSCATCSAYPRDALPELVPNWGEIAHHRPGVVLRPRAADRRDRRRPAVGAVRPDLLRRRATAKCTYGTGSFILTNTGTDARALGRRACSRRPPGARPTASSPTRSRARSS